MPYKRLFILVEGDDDERFFRRIILPLYKSHYDHVQIWLYQQEKKKTIKAFIRTLKKMEWDYIFVRDINNNPCVTKAKNKICTRYPDIDDRNKIAIVIKEIESWYTAGLKGADAKKLTGRTLRETDTLIKEQFDRLIPPKSPRNVL